MSDQELNEYDEDNEPAPANVRARRAAALHYGLDKPAPTVVASGRGQIAEQIIAAAQAAGVPIREDPALAEALAALEIDSIIPQELYRAVAEALAWAYRVDGQVKR